MAAAQRVSSRFAVLVKGSVVRHRARTYRVIDSRTAIGESGFFGARKGFRYASAPDSLLRIRKRDGIEAQE